MARTACTFSNVVVASPTAAVETQIALIGPISPVVDLSPLFLFYWFTLAMGATGTGCTVKIRQGNGITGAIILGAGTTHSLGAGGGANLSGFAFDASPGADQLYSLTITCLGATAPSTVSTAFFGALVL